MKQPDPQIPLFQIKPIPKEARKLNTAERFRLFDELNPWVYREIKERAFECVRLGDRKIGMRAIIEDIRWHVKRETRGQEKFKINNDIVPDYVDKLVAEYPRFAEYFERRARRADRGES